MEEAVWARTGGAGPLANITVLNLVCLGLTSLGSACKNSSFFGGGRLPTAGYSAGNSVNCPHWMSLAGRVIAEN